jgi:hypothetical protein
MDSVMTALKSVWVLALSVMAAAVNVLAVSLAR